MKINRRSILGLLAAFPFCGFLKADEKPKAEKPKVIEYQEFEVSQICVNLYARKAYTWTQVNKIPDMVASIEKFGLLEPIIVRMVDDKPHVVDGLLRYLACISIKAKTNKPMYLMCRILDDNPEVVIIPSSPRQETTPQDYATAIRRILERNPNLTLKDVAVKTGHTEQYFKRLLRKYP